MVPGFFTYCGRGLLVLAFFYLALACDRPHRIENGFCSIGSEELNTAMAHWSRQFAEDRQEPPLVHEGRGSAIAPRALLEGTCDLGPMSRPMNDAEVHSFVERFGEQPVAIPVALEALAIVVPASNPRASISFEELRSIYLPPSEEPGPEGELQQLPEYQPFGINTASDRYRWFRAAVLDGRKEGDHVLEVSGPLELVDRVAQNAHAIGYARPAELTDFVRAPGLSDENQIAVAPTAQNIRRLAYPLTRTLYIYLPPQTRPEALDGRTVAFLQFVLSPAGQAVLEPLGLYPLADGDRVRMFRIVEGLR